MKPKSKTVESRHIKKYGRVLDVDEHTSVRLGRIRQRHTKAELEVRRLLHSLGYRYRTSNRDLPGSPDIANRSRRWAVFVQGCFWHHHEGCARATIPKRNRDFWLEKFARNRARDARTLSQLVARGFKCIVIWECEIGGPGLRAKIASELKGTS